MKALLDASVKSEPRQTWPTQSSGATDSVLDRVRTSSAQAEEDVEEEQDWFDDEAPPEAQSSVPRGESSHKGLQNGATATEESSLVLEESAGDGSGASIEQQLINAKLMIAELTYEKEEYRHRYLQSRKQSLEPPEDDSQ